MKQKRMQSVSLMNRSFSFGFFLLLFLFDSNCIMYSILEKEKSIPISPTNLEDKESYLVLRLVRGKDQSIGNIEEIPVKLTFESNQESTKQRLRIYPIPLAKPKEPFFLPLSSKSEYREEMLLVGCLYFFPIPNFFRGNLILEIHHTKTLINREFLFQKTVPYDWQGNRTKYWEYDLDHREMTDKTIPSLSSYRHLECENDIRHRKEIPKKGIVSPPEED
ncbi:hypothetical protein ND856_17735 [Leptospira bandrabouensis]|uniref:hypothetical protein n=1 Tax=Leptospira bandrabouensis TaxID=2484903 RepID=UPI00223E35FF|nr:hypothetical protein [Leptospira bandrabouensis]MCW7458016.1 hypothetical protein [Leptospira bandrabouensis]MCW7479145.1 hypothetical protein [Leptospira bandrabouensis]MCW7486727.1 hypothetical protein [Leptospira bandrabouensis]